MDTSLQTLLNHAAHSPLHLCVDLARAPDGLRRITGSSGHQPPEHARNLFDTALTTDADAVSPWLLPCPDAKRQIWLSRSLALAREQPAVLWLFGSLPTVELLQRMSRRLDVTLNDGTELLLRYFDPRILQELDQALSPDPHSEFFGLCERWCYLNRDGQLCELVPQTVAAVDAIHSPWRLHEQTEQALTLATEAGQVLADTLQRWPDGLQRRLPQAQFDLAKDCCAEADALQLNTLDDKMLLLALASQQKGDYLATPAWADAKQAIAQGTTKLAALLTTQGTLP
jgi:hypothetical protein